MNFEEYLPLIHQLCQNYQIKIFLETDYQETSYSAPPDLIYLGQYQNSEFKLISFFHELGHCFNAKKGYCNWPLGSACSDCRKCTYQHYYEASAWKTGLRVASRHQVKFTKEALQWAQQQLSSYFQDNHRERTPLRNSALHITAFH